MNKLEIQHPSTNQDQESSRRDIIRVIGGIGLTALITSNAASISAQTPTQPAATGPVGVSMQSMGVGEPGATPGLELTLRRTKIEVGGRLPAHSHPGSLVIYVEAGQFGYTALGGIANVTRKAVDGTPVPAESMPIGTEVVLVPGDWLYSEDPNDDIRNAGEDDVVLIVAGLTRIGEPFTTLMGEMDMGPTPTP